jgi:hypothetical protein
MDDRKAITYYSEILKKIYCTYIVEFLFLIISV